MSLLIPSTYTLAPSIPRFCPPNEGWSLLERELIQLNSITFSVSIMCPHIVTVFLISSYPELEKHETRPDSELLVVCQGVKFRLVLLVQEIINTDKSLSGG